MIRRSSGSIVTWRRAQIVLLAAQRVPATRIAGGRVQRPGHGA
jgi:hypothetical protein